MLFENLMFGPSVSTIQASFRASGSETSFGPAKTSLVHECDAPTYPSKIVPSDWLRFRSTPHALRESASVLTGVAPLFCTFVVQKSAAIGSSSSLPPITQWFVIFRRWLWKL